MSVKVPQGTTGTQEPGDLHEAALAGCHLPALKSAPKFTLPTFTEIPSPHSLSRHGRAGHHDFTLTPSASFSHHGRAGHHGWLLSLLSYLLLESRAVPRKSLELHSMPQAPETLVLLVSKDHTNSLALMASAPLT